MKVPSVLFVTRKELLSFWSIFWVLLIGVIYILLTVFLLNYRLVFASVQDAFPFRDTWEIFLSLLIGVFTAFSPFDGIVFLLSAFLIGVNVVLIAKTLYVLEHGGRIRLSVGGAALFGIISAGCSSCGFSVLSLLGLSASFSFLPFRGMELHVLSLGLLAFSAYYMIKKLRDGLYCKR